MTAVGFRNIAVDCSKIPQRFLKDSSKIRSSIQIESIWGWKFEFLLSAVLIAAWTVLEQDEIHLTDAPRYLEDDFVLIKQFSAALSNGF